MLLSKKKLLPQKYGHKQCAQLLAVKWLVQSQQKYMGKNY